MIFNNFKFGKCFIFKKTFQQKLFLTKIRKLICYSGSNIYTQWGEKHYRQYNRIRLFLVTHLILAGGLCAVQ